MKQKFSITLTALLSLSASLLQSCKSTQNPAQLQNCNTLIEFLEMNTHHLSNNTFYVDSSINVSIQEIYQVLEKSECWYDYTREYFLNFKKNNTDKFSITVRESDDFATSNSSLYVEFNSLPTHKIKDVSTVTQESAKYGGGPLATTYIIRLE